MALPIESRLRVFGLPQDVENFINSKILPSIPQDDRWSFFEYGLPATLQHKPNQKTWQAVSDILPSIPQAHRWSFFRYGLPATLQHKPNPEKLREHSRIALQYLNENPNDHFFGKIVAENFGRLGDTKKLINRLQFQKTGSCLIPLGGKLKGIIIRQIRPGAYAAWKTAYQHPELGRHVEPILEKKGRLRARQTNDNVFVSTRYVGSRIAEFIQSHPDLAVEVNRQKRWILDKCEEIGIEHGHAHDNNFTVEVVMGKPVVRLIDFDQAVYGSS